MFLPIGQFLTHSHHETFELGYSIGRSLETPTKFFLEGDLGVGKTVLAKGLICGLGQGDPDDVPSPSYTLINEYALRFKVYHLDLFRLDSMDDLKTLDLEEIFSEPAVIIVEWAEKLAAMKITDAVHVKILNSGNDIRQITIYSWKEKTFDEA